jgi:hypothetical protein
MYHVLDTKHPNPDPTFGIGPNIISAIETGLALMTVCVPDLLPLLKQYVPKLLGRESTAKDSNLYAYGANSRNLRATKKSGYVQTDSKNASTVRGKGDREAGYQMDNTVWDRTRPKGSVTNAYGGYPSPSSSLAGSDEGIIIIEGGKSILKTTQISVQSSGQ